MNEEEIKMGIIDIMDKNFDKCRNQKPFPHEKWRHQVIIDTKQFLKDEDPLLRDYYLNTINDYFQSKTMSVQYGRFN